MIPKLNLLARKENCEEKTSGSNHFKGMVPPVSIFQYMKFRGACRS